MFDLVYQKFGLQIEFIMRWIGSLTYLQIKNHTFCYIWVEFSCFFSQHILD